MGEGGGGYGLRVWRVVFIIMDNNWYICCISIYKMQWNYNKLRNPKPRIFSPCPGGISVVEIQSNTDVLYIDACEYNENSVCVIHMPN